MKSLKIGQWYKITYKDYDNKPYLLYCCRKYYNRYGLSHLLKEFKTEHCHEIYDNYLNSGNVLVEIPDNVQALNILFSASNRDSLE